LIVSGIQYLYQDLDILTKEAKVLFMRAVQKIRKLTRKHLPVALVNDVYRPGKRNLLPAAVENSDRHLAFTSRRNSVRIYDVNDGTSADYVPVHPGQAMIEDF